MSVFNPQVQAGQDNSPNYFKFSEPISQPKSDTSTGIALSTIGEGIEGATKLADQTAKDVMNKDVHDTVDPIRDDQTKSLEALRNAQQGNAIPAPVQTAAGGTTSLLDSNASMDTPVPAAIDAGLGKIDAVQNALSSGKINDTYYTQRLNSAAVDLRTKYPGYRDYIDQRIAQTTGINPANAYMTNLMQDINQRAVKKDSEAEKTETMLRGALQDHVPNADVMLQYYRNNKGNPDAQTRVEQFIYQSQSEKAAIDLQNSRRALANGNRDDINTQRTQDFTNEAGAAVASNFKALVTIPGVDTPQGITDFMKTVAAHPEQYTDAQLKTLDSQLMAQKSVLANQLKARSTEMSKDANGRTYSYASDMGGADKVDQVIKSQLSVYDNIHDALTGGGPQGAGLAFWHANQITARFADAHEKMLAGPMGNDIKTFKILNDDMGPTFAGILVPKLLNSGIDQKLTGLFNQSATDARAQPDFDGSGRPLTYMDHIKRANDLQSEGKMNDGMKARYQAGLVKIGQDIQDPSIPDVTKAKVVNYLFSPEGQGLLGTFKTDYVNSEGKTVPGKYAVFNALTSQGMVDSITKLAKTDPTIGDKYKNYLENEAGSQLFYKEFQNMNRVTGHDDLHFKYNDGSNTPDGLPKVTLIDRDGKDIQQPRVVPGQWNTGNNSSPTYTAGLLEQVNHVNQALTGMARVEKGLGGDVNSYVLNVLQHSQVNMGQNWTGLPAKLADAIAASRAPQKRIDEVFKDIK